MEFWGAQVKAGKPLTVKPDQGCLIHVSQISLGKGTKGEPVLLYVTVDGKKLVIGTLSYENIPQLGFDLVFEKEFELSHSLERGSVHFVGYKSHNIDHVSTEEGDYSSEKEEEVELPKAKKRKKSSTATDEISDDDMLALKKRKTHKAKSQENDGDERTVSKNEFKEIKKSIKELSETVRKLQETLLTKADLLEVVSSKEKETSKKEEARDCLECRHRHDVYVRDNSRDDSYDSMGMHDSDSDTDDDPDPVDHPFNPPVHPVYPDSLKSWIRVVGDYCY